MEPWPESQATFATGGGFAVPVGFGFATFGKGTDARTAGATTAWPRSDSGRTPGYGGQASVG